MWYLNYEDLRQTTGLLICFLFVGLVACEQTKTIAAKEESRIEPIAIDSSQTDIYTQLKDSLSMDWVRENPELADTKPSFFNKSKADDYLVVPIQISGLSIPFAWDDELSILKYLFSRNDKIEIRKGVEADPNYKGLKIKWEEAPLALLWVNDKAYRAPITEWYLIKDTDCPGTINFPTLSFEKQFDVPNAINNRLDGLAIIPFSNEINKITSSDVSLKTKSGMLLNGKTFDINDDGTGDLFLYDEEIDETPSYSRLYINIDGKWECRYVKLDEVCI
jgi:hypothetical protein